MDQNHIIYNFTTIVELSGISYFFYHSCESKLAKRTILLCFSLAGLSLVINLIFIEPDFLVFQSFFSFISSLATFVIVSVYFFDILGSQLLINVLHRIEFYVASGILIYQLGQIPFTIIQNFHETMTDESYLVFLQHTLQYSSMIMYGLFTLGLYRCKKI